MASLDLLDDKQTDNVILYQTQETVPILLVNRNNSQKHLLPKSYAKCGKQIVDLFGIKSNPNFPIGSSLIVELGDQKIQVPKELSKTIINAFNKTKEELENYDCQLWTDLALNVPKKLYGMYVKTTTPVFPNFSIVRICEPNKFEEHHTIIHLQNNIFIEKSGMSACIRICTFSELQQRNPTKTVFYYRTVLDFSCNICGKKDGPLLICDVCKAVLYCSTKCMYTKEHLCCQQLDPNKCQDLIKKHKKNYENIKNTFEQDL